MNEEIKLVEIVIKGKEQEGMAMAFIQEQLNLLPEDAKVRLTLELITDISSMKKRYFAMVRELCLYAGYVSHQDRELFKTQVKQQLSIKSIKDIESKEEMGAAIEGLHKLAAEHYTYTFKDAADLFTFDFSKGRAK